MISSLNPYLHLYHCPSLPRQSLPDGSTTSSVSPQRGHGKPSALFWGNDTFQSSPRPKPANYIQALERLSPKEQEELYQYLNYLVRHIYLGATACGLKPISVTMEMPHWDERYKLWKRFESHIQNPPFILEKRQHFNTTPYNTIVTINPQAVLRVVKTHLKLFREQTQNPHLTPQMVLDALLHHREADVLNNPRITPYLPLQPAQDTQIDPILFGLLLGYGEDNSKIGGRYHILLDATRGNMTPVLGSPIKPSFGFSSLQDELQFLETLFDQIGAMSPEDFGVISQICKAMGLSEINPLPIPFTLDMSPEHDARVDCPPLTVVWRTKNGVAYYEKFQDNAKQWNQFLRTSPSITHLLNALFNPTQCLPRTQPT